MSIWVNLIALLSSLLLASATGVCLIMTIFVCNVILFRAAGATALLAMIVESAIVMAVTAKGAWKNTELAEGSIKRTIAFAILLMKRLLLSAVLLEE